MQKCPDCQYYRCRCGALPAPPAELEPAPPAFERLAGAPAGWFRIGHYGPHRSHAHGHRRARARARMGHTARGVNYSTGAGGFARLVYGG